MEEEHVKSALEIAMERVSRLPELTAEEISAQKEKEYRPIGEALCHRYLQGILDAGSLESAMHQYAGDPGRIVRQSLAACLSRAIGLEDTAAAAKALEFLGSAVDGPARQEKARAQWRQILEEYERRREVLIQTQTLAAGVRLASLGISGSAVVPALDGDAQYAQALAALHRDFEPQLEELRTMLRDSVRRA